MSEIKPTGISRTRYDEETEVVRSMLRDEQTEMTDEELDKPLAEPMVNTNRPPEAISLDDQTQTFDRYAELSLVDDTVVIYDRENPRRWVQSGTAVHLAEVR